MGYFIRSATPPLPLTESSCSGHDRFWAMCQLLCTPYIRTFSNFLAVRDWLYQRGRFQLSKQSNLRWQKFSCHATICISTTIRYQCTGWHHGWSSDWAVRSSTLPNGICHCHYDSKLVPTWWCTRALFTCSLRTSPNIGINVERSKWSKSLTITVARCNSSRFSL